MTNGLYRYDFEKPIAELAHRLSDARKGKEKSNPASLRSMEHQFEQLRHRIYGSLTPWQRVQLARHPLRPYTLDYIQMIMTEFVELHTRANGMTGDVIRPAQKLKVPKGHFSVVVDKSSNQLLLTEDNQFFKAYPVATGKDNATPEGSFKIVNKIPNPVWYKQGASVPPDSPDNVLGTRWMGFDKKGYGIHGSVDPSDIGKYVTAGCVRMTNADVEELYTILPVGADVTIVQ